MIYHPWFSQSDFWWMGLGGFALGAIAATVFFVLVRVNR